MRRLSAAVVLVAVAGLTACDPAETVSGPDPDEAAAALASALSSGDFSGVEFTNKAPDEVATEYAEVVDAMGDVEPSVTADGTDTSDGSGTVVLSWSWPVAGREWTYTSEADLTEAGDTWEATWNRAVVEPTLGARSVLDLTPIAGARGPIVGAGGVELVTDRPVLRFGIDKTLVPAARAGDSARRLAQLVGIDAPAYAKRVRAAGDKAFVEAIVLREQEVPPAAERGYEAIKGARAIPGELPLAPTRGFAAPILGTRRRRDRRDDREGPGAATRSATRSACPASRGGTTTSCRAPTARSCTR